MALFFTGTDSGTDTEVWYVPLVNADWVRLSFYQAMTLLSEPINWQQDGILTAEDAASFFSEAFNKMYTAPSPIGSIIPYAASVDALVPYALACDGASYPTDTYQALFAVIGYTFGGTGANFNVPDLRSRFITGSGGTINGSSVVVGSIGGSFSHTQTADEMPAHTHTDLGHTHGYIPAVPIVQTLGPELPAPAAVPGAALSAIGNANLTNTGGGSPMDIANPYIGLNYAIVTGRS